MSIQRVNRPDVSTDRRRVDRTDVSIERVDRPDVSIEHVNRPDVSIERVNIGPTCL